MTARRRRGCLYILLFVAIALAVLWIFHARLLAALGAALVENDPLENAQAAVVLGGDDSGERILKAAQLAQAGYAPYVIVDGPATLIGHESDMTIEYARRHGFAESLFHALPLPKNLDYTRAETAYVGKYLESHDIRKILLITSNFHTRRAARLIRQQNPWLHVIVVAAPDPTFHPNDWWKSRDGQKTFFLETLKTMAAWVGD